VTDTIIGIPTPGSINSDSTSSSDTIDVERDMPDLPWSPSTFNFAAYDPLQDDFGWIPEFTIPVLPKPGDLATTYFFNHVANKSQWEFMREFAAERPLDPCLDLAVKACGMAALGNAENLPISLDSARSMYTVALGLLNEALRDSRKCKTDESLIAVSLLGRYENLMCEGRDSIQSWKAHIKGSTQLLKVRGKSQFKTQIGRIMYREMRAQAMIMAIWDDQYVPPFFRDYQDELDTYPEEILALPIDTLTKILFDFADLRAHMRFRRIPPPQAAAQASELEKQFMQWELDTMAYDERWTYFEMDVNDSEDIWDGRVHSYTCLPAPTVWNTYRNMRIMLTRTQEWLCRRLPLSDLELDEQLQYFRTIRRQLTDEICATIPVSLGTPLPAFTSPCVLVSAYGAIWPLFFAGTCALERLDPRAMSVIIKGEPLPPGQMSNKAGAQAAWILGRLEYISNVIGLKWADGVAAVLRGDFKVAQHLVDKDNKRPYPRYTRYERAQWLKQVEDAERGERLGVVKVGVQSDQFMDDYGNREQPIWPEKDIGGPHRMDMIWNVQP
jgi:hypothetical protein